MRVTRSYPILALRAVIGRGTGWRLHPMWITDGFPTDARRRPGHNNDRSLKESACLEDPGRPTKTHRSAPGRELRSLFDSGQR
jgi:hypothetical protein